MDAIAIMFIVAILGCSAVGYAVGYAIRDREMKKPHQ
jgi:hypothetical protein